jgi:hypothetical protein
MVHSRIDFFVKLYDKFPFLGGCTSEPLIPVSLNIIGTTLTLASTMFTAALGTYQIPVVNFAPSLAFNLMAN